MLVGGRLNETLETLRGLLTRCQDPVVDTWDPLELSLLVARLEYEDLDVEKHRKAFRELVATHRAQVPADAPLRDQAQALAKVFSEVLGFGGDRANYYNIKNSFMNDVLLRRKGIPITLSLVFMALAKEFGIRSVGIAFPGHFLVRLVPAPGQQFEVEDWRSQWFIDAFDGGKILSIDECEKRLKEWTRGVVAFGPDALRPAHPADIVARILRNLRAIFAEKEDLPRLYYTLTALIEISGPDRVESFRERGFILARMGRYSAATQDLGRYLSLCKDPQKIAHVEQMLRYFESKSEMMN